MKNYLCQSCFKCKGERIFKKIRGYDYEVSDKGEVRNMKTGSILKPHIHDKWGHLEIRLYKNGKIKAYSIHRLVLKTFVSSCPKGMEACHNNGKADDNRIENLRWDTHRNNMKDSIDQETLFIAKGSKNGRAKLTDNQVREIRDRYIRFSKNANSVILAKEFGVSYTEICDIINNKTWKHIK